MSCSDYLAMQPHSERDVDALYSKRPRYAASVTVASHKQIRGTNARYKQVITQGGGRRRQSLQHCARYMSKVETLAADSGMSETWEQVYRKSVLKVKTELLQIFSAIDHTLEVPNIILIEMVCQEAQRSQIERNQLQQKYLPSSSAHDRSKLQASSTSCPAHLTQEEKDGIWCWGQGVNSPQEFPGYNCKREPSRPSVCRLAELASPICHPDRHHP